MSALLVFVCGAFYEASCIGFVHYAEAGGAWRTALMSVLAGLAEVTGIFGTVKDWHVGPFFVAGLGVGAYLGVRFKGRDRTGCICGNCIGGRALCRQPGPDWVAARSPHGTTPPVKP